MNRKQKIIVSITGIFLVLMILVGLTYAYFLTKITGNTNTKSISVSTANLVLEYGENTNVVQGINNAEPGYSVEKIFTATNKGNSTVTYGAALESIVNELSRQQDLVYTLTCTSYLKEGFSLANDGTITGTVDGTCNEVSTETKFPSTSIMSIMTTNTIDTTHTQAYKLTITYKEMGEDQSEDMNKTFSAKVNIVDLNAVARKNPYEGNKNSLAYNIINNAMNKTNGTELVGTPATKVAEAISYKRGSGEYAIQALTYEQMPYGFGPWLYSDTELDAKGGTSAEFKKCADLIGKYIYDESGNMKDVFKVEDCDGETPKTKVEIIDYEKELNITSDDYGISYYYRGNVIDNYVNFAGMCWRIVRIVGDGSVKLIIEDPDNTCNSSDGEWGGSSGSVQLNHKFYASGELTATDGTKNVDGIDMFTGVPIEVNGISTLENYTDKLKEGGWCFADASYLSGNDGSSKLTKNEVMDNKIKNVNFFYDTYVRLIGKVVKEPTLICNGTIFNGTDYNENKQYFGYLTVDEIVFAGGKIDEKNMDYYLINDSMRSGKVGGFLSSTPKMFGGSYENVFYVNEEGAIKSWDVDHSGVNARIAIQLKNDIEISGGNGTKENPYIVQ